MKRSTPPVIQKRHAIFYGWWVVLSCSLIMLYTSGITYYGFTAVFEPIANEFGWSYTEISLGASLRGLETGLLAPVVGLVVDRWGTRSLIFGGTVITGVGLVLLSRIDSLGTFYFAFILISMGISINGHASMMPAVANWFRKRVAMATGVLASGAALGGLLVPLVALLIEQVGWRDAMFVLGLGIFVICLPLTLLIRHKPQQYGYLPDGEEISVISTDEDTIVTPSVETHISTKEAMRNRAFWHIATALTTQAMAVSAVLTHIMPYLSSVGVDRATSSLAAGALPLASIIGRMSFGWMGDRFEKRRIAAAGLALTGVGSLLFCYASVEGTVLLLLFLVIFGTGWGGNVTMRAALLREYYGRESFGTIHGFTLGILTLGTIIGAPFAGWIFDQWHSYQGAWLALVFISAIAVFIMLTTPLSMTASNRLPVEKKTM